MSGGVVVFVFAAVDVDSTVLKRSGFSDLGSGDGLAVSFRVAGLELPGADGVGGVGRAGEAGF